VSAFDGSLTAGTPTWAAAEGLDAVTLTTFRDVPFNDPFYERCGFRVIEPARYGPQLAVIRRRERDSGIDVAPRVATRRRFDRWLKGLRPAEGWTSR
jgi:hypothetical protein